MSLFTDVKNFFISNRQHRFTTDIPPERVFPRTESRTLAPDVHYFRLWVHEMFLDHGRVLLSKREPVIHAHCGFLYKGNQEIVPLVLGPGQIKGLQFNKSNIVALNHQILGPIPFFGGRTEILLALFSVESRNYLLETTEILGSLSDLLRHSEIKTALKYSVPVIQGLQNLLRPQSSPHIGIHETFSSGETSHSPFKSGYRVVINTQANNISQDELWVKNGKLRYGKSFDKAVPFDKASYILYSIEAMNKRDDWTVLTSIQDAWDNAISKASNESEEEIQSSLDAFRGVVLASHNLIWSDKFRLVEALVNRINQVIRLKKLNIKKFDDKSFQESLNIEPSLQGSTPIELARKKSREDLLRLKINTN